MTDNCGSLVQFLLVVSLLPCGGNGSSEPSSNAGDLLAQWLAAGAIAEPTAFNGPPGGGVSDPAQARISYLGLHVTCVTLREWWAPSRCTSIGLRAAGRQTGVRL